MDTDEIRVWREKAEAGSVPYQTLLGICYLDGMNGPPDYEEAFRLLSGAASHGAARAISNLARMYSEGMGIPRDLTKAIELYERAAASGEFLAQIALGRIYSRGIGVPTNLRAAFAWYSEALAQTDSVAPCEDLEEARVFVSAHESEEKV